MNKKLLTLITILLFLVLPSTAQTYSSLWKQYEKAREKDLPDNAIQILSAISNKARRDNSYGHLLKSQLCYIAVQSEISPDSLIPQVKHYEARISKSDDVVLGAVYCSTLGYIYKNNWMALGLREDSAMNISKRYYKQSLRYPKILASKRAGLYEPLLIDGDNSLVFNDDMLHVLAMEAGEYGLMKDYYKSVGNRPAACISSLYELKERCDTVKVSRKSKYLATVDSLIHEYHDLPEAGELAIEHFNYLESATDASAQEKIEYIDYALINWPTWPRISVLKNARNRITLPAFHATINETLTIPNKPIPVYVTSLTNLQRLRLNLYKVNITGMEEFNPNNPEEYSLLKSKLSDKTVYDDERVYYGLPEYMSVRDTLLLPPLSNGVYMLEFITDNNSVAIERAMLNISNLRLIDMDLPDNRKRLAVVDATTGKPIAGARVRIKFREWKDREWVEDEQVLTTESDGEVIFSSTLSPYRYMICTDTDRAFTWQYIGRSMWSTPNYDVHAVRARVFTDRSIYRPGQKAQLSVIAYNVFGRNDWRVSEGKSLKAVLRNAKYEKVDEQNVVTDEYGVGALAFNLPKDGTTGHFIVQVLDGGRNIASSSFRVEEYKRPTFDVKLDDYSYAYHEGDTITVRGYAKTYAGAPLQNATVSYNVSKGYMFWWHNPSLSSATTQIYSSTTTTVDDGSFLAKVPIEMPEGAKTGMRFAKVILNVTATSTSGESHDATANYPLSDRATAFFLSDFKEQQCREQQSSFKFSYYNNSGKEIDTTLVYAIDGGSPLTLRTNTETKLDISNLKSGKHSLQAICNNDTINSHFIVFSLKDNTAPVDTAAWYYSTLQADNRVAMIKGKPEYVQYGTSLSDQTVFYAVASESSLIESGQQTLSNEAVTREFDYKDEWGEGLSVRYTWVRDGKMYSYSDRFARPTEENKLNVEWSTFRDKLTPGQKEEWKITVRNADGSPAKAQTMAVLYDKSLDALASHNWHLDHTVSYMPRTIGQYANYDVAPVEVYGEQSYNPVYEPSLSFTRFDIPYFSSSFGNVYAESLTTRAMRPRKTIVVGSIGGQVAMAKSADAFAANEGTADIRIRGTQPMPPAASEQDAPAEEPVVPLRENLSETAFFMPQLVTDSKGAVAIKFTLPESLTTWRFMSLSHDKVMNIGSLKGEVIAQKKLMIQPNMPRFVREGDNARISANITNSSDKDLSGKSTLVIVSPNDDRTIVRRDVSFNVAAGKQTSVTFDVPSSLASDVYVCRITAQTPSFSDGEQHLLPVLTNAVEVTTTRAFTQTKPGKKVVDLASLYGSNATKESLKVEYTNNPAWLMLEALPVVSTPNVENAISLATSLYANSVTERLIQQLPEDTTLNKTSRISPTEIIGRLANLQNHDGSFSWFKGMQPSSYVTQAVAKMLARIKHQGLASSSINPMLANAMTSLDRDMADYVASLKKMERELKSKPMPSDMALDYLYIQTVMGEKLSSTAAENAKYLFSLLDGMSSKLTIYGKANMAVVFARHPMHTDAKIAGELLESIRQYTVKTEEMGRYFDTPKAKYSWFDYKIPTQTSAIEALQTIAPDDRQTIADMQLWLLQEKRTQQWDTPINSASAIYAFFNGWDFSGKASTVKDATKSVDAVRLFVDNRQIAGGSMVSGKGVASETMMGRYSTFTADKTSDNVSWGAVYVTATQPLQDVDAAGEALYIKREIVDERGNDLTSAPIVGQKVRVRLTITSQRDLDFVEVTDNRAACLEPVVQVSGYRRGCYEEPRDSKTVYYFDQMTKGKHVVETEYYIDRAGNYVTGIATAKCLYAPEYQGRDKALNVETK